MCDNCHLNFNPEIQSMLIYQFLSSLGLSQINCNHPRDTGEIFDVSRHKPF